jgi:hypothetical protein
MGTKKTLNARFAAGISSLFNLAKMTQGLASQGSKKNRLAKTPKDTRTLTSAMMPAAGHPADEPGAAGQKYKVSFIHGHIRTSVEDRLKAIKYHLFVQLGGLVAYFLSLGSQRQNSSTASRSRRLRVNRHRPSPPIASAYLPIPPAPSPMYPAAPPMAATPAAMPGTLDGHYRFLFFGGTFSLTRSCTTTHQASRDILTLLPVAWAYLWMLLRLGKGLPDSILAMTDCVVPMRSATSF